MQTNADHKDSDLPNVTVVKIKINGMLPLINILHSKGISGLKARLSGQRKSGLPMAPCTENVKGRTVIRWRAKICRNPYSALRARWFA
jgi:hypothetical protein